MLQGRLRVRGGLTASGEGSEQGLLTSVCVKGMAQALLEKEVTSRHTEGPVIWCMCVCECRSGVGEEMTFAWLGCLMQGLPPLVDPPAKQLAHGIQERVIGPLSSEEEFLRLAGGDSA